MPAQVKKVLTIKYAAKPFGQLTEIEQIAHSLGLLLKINVVTGWPVPESDESQNILAEQLKLYLIENWSLYNVDEIMYAMRSYATVLNNWGKNMNLSLIGSAMIEYEKERNDISQLEESQAMKPQTTNLLTMPADWKELCELYYQDYLNNRFTLSVMPWQLYDEFVRCGMMDPEVYQDWLGVAKRSIVTRLNFEKQEALASQQIREANILQNQIESLTTECDYITFEAKKLAVQFLYKTAKSRNIKHLFKKS